MILFEELDFDTELFKVNTFRITDLVVSKELDKKNLVKTATVLIDAADKDMKSANAKFIQCKLDARSQHLAKVFQDQYYFLASEDVTLCKELSSIKYADLVKDYEVKFCEEKDGPALYQLSKEAYKTTRFHQDPHIRSEDADEMQGRWIKNCYYQKLADEIILVKKNNELCGYVACVVIKDKFLDDKKVGRIVLIATDERYRGKGIGSLLVQESDAWFRKQGCSAVVVGTQTINTPALNFYQKNGFRVINSTWSFHKWL
jgi:ribosomal protein S18 acetylase RimI-like enzyme